MSISIVSCPKCGTFLLNDTAQCHRCKFVIHPEQATQFRDASLPTDAAIQQDMERCRQCGEACRKGLVRCWSCGAFTRPEIEAAYYRLLQGHSHAATSSQKYELPEITSEEARKRYWNEEDAALAPAGEYTAVDDDFELTGSFSLMEGASLGGEITETELNGAETIPLLQPEPAAVAAATNGPAPSAAASPAVAKPPPADQPPSDDADSLLSNAQQEETDVQKARKAKLATDGFVIFCPNGCKIRVQERHRGKIGRCPKCQSTFVVPMARQTSVAGSVGAATDAGAVPAAAAVPASAGMYSRWMKDAHLHKVAPEKLRIKADSLLKDFQEVDIGFDPTGIVLVTPAAGGGGMFGGKNAKKKDESRAVVVEQLAAKGTLEGLPTTFAQAIARDAVGQIALSQPAPPGAESIFGDIPVFGAGRIAIRLPKFDDKTTPYLSFSLSEFREFSRLAGELYGIESFGSGSGIPLQDVYKTSPCHFTKGPVKELQNLTYYEKDPAFKLEISGYRCKVCQTVISETARAGQKLGGANAKGIAKVKCPKCTKPMGSQPVYVVPAAPAQAGEESAAGDSPAAEEKSPETTAAV